MDSATHTRMMVSSTEYRVTPRAIARSLERAINWRKMMGRGSHVSSWKYSESNFKSDYKLDKL